MKNEELISIIVPIYNTKKYFERCINSLINQTYNNIEICIVDDGSSDGSEILCDEYAKKEKRIKVYHQENSGPAIARNKGLEMATGDYIFFVDSDDYIHPETFDYLLKELKKYDADISCCAARLVYEDGTEKKYLEEERYLLNREEALEHSIFRNTIGSVVWAKLYKKELFKGISFPPNKHSEDEYVVYKIVGNSNKTIYTGRYLYSLFERSDSLSSTGIGNREMNYLEAWCERDEYLRNKGYNKLANRSIENMTRVIYEKCKKVDNERAWNNIENAIAYVERLIKNNKNKILNYKSIIKLLLLRIVVYKHKNLNKV